MAERGAVPVGKGWQLPLHPGLRVKEVPWQLPALPAALGGSSAHGGPGRVPAWHRLGSAEGAEQLSPRALTALCLAPACAQVSPVVLQ